MRPSIHRISSRVGTTAVAWSVVFAGLLVASTPATGFADDLTRGGEIWLPVPQLPTKILLEQATVDAVLPVDDAPFSVTMTLVLKNAGRKPATIALALPERPCNGDTETCNGRGAGTYNALLVVVGGAPVTPQPMEPDADALYKPDFGRVFGFSTEIAARSKVEVVVTYTVAQTVDAEGTYASIRGAGLWGRGLKKIDITLHLPQRPWTLGHSSDLKLASYETGIGTSGALAAKPETTIVFSGRATKARDSEIHLGTSNRLGGALRCPNPRAIAEAAAAEDASARLGKLLVMRNDGELAACRTLYLARQGFPFTDKEQQQRFYGKPVRSASMTETILEGRDRPYLRYGLQLNRRYTSALHPKEEATYIDAIAAELRRRRDN